MTKSGKPAPREFWLLCDEFSNRALTRDLADKWPDDIGGNPSGNWIHMIEHSALLAAQAEVESLKAKLKIATDALEFYANDKNYTNDGIVFVTTYYGDYMNPPEQEQDYGGTAQKTLAKLSDTDNQSTQQGVE